jgi:hypothetical protein
MASMMKAVNYVGPHQVRVEEVEKPKIEHPDDIIVKITTVSLIPNREFLVVFMLIHFTRQLFAVPIYSTTSLKFRKGKHIH